MYERVNHRGQLLFDYGTLNNHQTIDRAKLEILVSAEFYIS